jgi:hypothetical protein
MTSFTTALAGRRPAPAAMMAALVLTAIAPSCDRTGLPSSRRAFLSRYCELVRPCCARAHLPTDGAQCQFLMGDLVPAGTFDESQAEACLAEIQAVQDRTDFCEPAGAPAEHACDRVLSGGHPAIGQKHPGEPCARTEDCAPSGDGAVICQEDYGGRARTRFCQVQARGKEGDGPCLFTVPELPSTFPFPDLRTFVSVSFERAADVAPPPRAFHCDLADGLRCSSQGEPHRCVAVTPIGATCSQPLVCAATAYCNGRGCAARPALGEACTPSPWSDVDPPCLSGAQCDPASGTCSAKRRQGEPCTDNLQCRGGRCVNGACDAELDLRGVCGVPAAPIAGPGAP